MRSPETITYKGRTFFFQELEEIREIVGSCQGLSRTELANTICENFEWKRPTERLKTVEGRQFLEYLEAKGYLRLPQRRARRPMGSRTRIRNTEAAEGKAIITGKAGAYAPLFLVKVGSLEERRLWYEYIERYHYLGYQVPFGAQLRYFIKALGGRGPILGCVQFSSPAWKVGARDRWIGWSVAQRERNLQKLIHQSRFLILPWVEVRNLASTVLGLCARVVPGDWERHYGYRAVLLETFVDWPRYGGTCYRAANWICLGKTAGRGRGDRENKRGGRRPKQIYVYPLMRGFREALLGG
ncbi:MAG: Druantia anti-phage system protein DruA [Planctomycetota bacterium]